MAIGGINEINASQVRDAGAKTVAVVRAVSGSEDPESAAKKIAMAYGYDQVVIIARKVGEDGGEHVTTYGVDKAHCDSAAKQGDALKRFMGWPL